MADSTPLLPQMATSQANKETVYNEGMSSVSPAAMYGRNYLTTTGMTWGYFGGRWNGTLIPNGTVTFVGSATHYVVANRSTGAVSTSTSATNWNDTANYIRLYQVATTASQITSYQDHRQAYGQSGGGGGGGTPGGSDTQVQYNSSGAFAGSANFTYNSTTNTLTVPRLATSASSSTQAGLSLPHGTAPAIPTNGDVWTTSAGMYVRINGATVGPLGSGGAGMTNPMTTQGDIIYGGASGTPIRLAASTAGYVLTANGPGNAPSWQAQGGAGPIFKGYATAATPIGGNVWTKINLGGESFDSDNCFDTSTSRFTPNKAGYYFFNALSNNDTSANLITVAFYKNGTGAAFGPNVNCFALGATALVYLNGTTDYVEMWVRLFGPAQNTVPGATLTYIEGFYVRA